MTETTHGHESEQMATIGPEGYPEGTRLPTLNSLKGMEVCDQHGEKIGKVSDVFLDSEARYVRYLVVGTGMMGSRKGTVPVDDVRYVEDRGDAHIEVPYTKDHLAAAPVLEDDEELTPEREHEIYEHYRRAGYWEEARQAVRDRQATPAPTPEIAKAEVAADLRAEHEYEASGGRARVRRWDR